MSYFPQAVPRDDRYLVSSAQYANYHRDGFLVVPNLVTTAEVAQALEHAMDLLYGKVTLPNMLHMEEGVTMAEREALISRVHMLHREDTVSERLLLHPKILDVLEALIGPDVLALQTMLFYNRPDSGGQGWHQDSYYIATYPDTLIGAWLALDTADEENGCLWVARGSNHEPIYPSSEIPNGYVHSEGTFRDVFPVENVSNKDEELNTLSPIARKYEVIPVPVNPGDVIFFHSHLMHRSYPNKATNRWRRSFVSHYCNARSWVPWNDSMPFDGDCGNYLHILARGATHLPYATPLCSNCGDG